jgi:hypothetical protein
MYCSKKIFLELQEWEKAPKAGAQILTYFKENAQSMTFKLINDMNES